MSERSSAEFVALLKEFKIPALLDSHDVVFGLWPDLTLAFTNPAWHRFAATNGGEPVISDRWRLGCSILDAISEPHRSFYEARYAEVLGALRPWEHLYECSSAAIERLFHMTALPIGKGLGILAVHSLRWEQPVDRSHAVPIETTYRNPQGMLIQCAHCRRFRRADLDSTWDWVRDWVIVPRQNTSHSICEPCLGFYYRLYIDGEHIPKPISTIDLDIRP